MFPTKERTRVNGIVSASSTLKKKKKKLCYFGVKEGMFSVLNIAHI